MKPFGKALTSYADLYVSNKGLNWSHIYIRWFNAWPVIALSPFQHITYPIAWFTQNDYERIKLKTD